MGQSVEHPTSARVMISRFVSSSPTSGSVLTAQSLKPASDSVSPSLSAPPPLVLCLSLSTINKRKKKKFSNIAFRGAKSSLVTEMPPDTAARLARVKDLR